MQFETTPPYQNVDFLVVQDGVRVFNSSIFFKKEKKWLYFPSAFEMPLPLAWFGLDVFI